MRIITPRTITDTEYIGGNLTEDDYDEWASGTDYVRGDFVIIISVHSVYQCLNDHTADADNSPLAEAAAFADPLVDDPDPAHWVRVGSTNKWRLFDGRPTQRAERAGFITVELQAPPLTCNYIAFIDLVDCGEIEATITNVDGVVVFNKTLELRDDSEVVDWFSYFYADLQIFDQVLTPIPATAETDTIDIVIRGSTDLGCGQIVLGLSNEVGESIIDATGIQILDYSEVEVNVYGDLTTVEREAVEVYDFSILTVVAKAFNISTSLRRQKGGKRAIWLADESPGVRGWIYGFITESRSVYESGTHIRTRLTIQGVT